MKRETLVKILLALARSLRVALSIVLLVCFVLLGSVVLIGFGLRDTVLQPGFSNSLLQNDQSLEQAQLFLARNIIQYAMFQTQSTWPVRTLPANDWQQIADNIAPKDWTYDSLKGFTEAAMDWMEHGDDMLPDYQFNLQPAKSSLSGNQGALMILPFMQLLPACQGDVSNFIFQENGLVNCIPSVSDQTNAATQMAGLLAQRLPDQVSLQELYQQGFLPNHIVANSLGARAVWRYVEEAMRMSLRPVLLLLSFYLLLNASSLYRLLRSASFALLMVGGLILVIIGVLALGPSLFGFDLRLPMPSGSSPAVESFIYFLLSTSLPPLAIRWLQIAAALVVAGVVLALLAQAWKIVQRSRTNAPILPEEKKYQRIKQSFR